MHGLWTSGDRLSVFLARWSSPSLEIWIEHETWMLNECERVLWIKPISYTNYWTSIESVASWDIYYHSPWILEPVAVKGRWWRIAVLWELFTYFRFNSKLSYWCSVRFQIRWSYSKNCSLLAGFVWLFSLDVWCTLKVLLMIWVLWIENFSFKNCSSLFETK